MTECRCDEYSEVLRSLASWLGAGGDNAPDPIVAREFEEKIRWGIDNFARESTQLLRLENEKLRSACALARNALDSLLGDSDLDDDSSIEMRAMQALSALNLKE